MITVRPAEILDCIVIGNNLREADKREVFTIQQHENFPASVIEGYNVSSKSFVGLKGNNPFFICGVIPVTDKIAYIWGLGTDDVKTVKKEFVKKCIDMFPELTEGFSYVFSYMDHRNTVHKKWCKMMGFTFDKSKNIKVNGVEFLFLYKDLRKDV